MSENALAPALPAAYSQTGSRLDYAGTGGELFGKMIVGAILCAITFGLYLPWFIVGLTRYQYGKTTLKTAGGNTIRFEFTATGGQMFALVFVGMLLTMLTFGIYYSWFINNYFKFITNNAVGTDDRGTKWKLQYDGTGGALFGVLFVGMLLTVITFYIYTPWMICNVRKHVLSQTRVVENGTPVGQLDFLGQGGDLFVTFLVGVLLTVVTFSLYRSWFDVKLMKFYAANLRVTLHNRVFTSDFVGLGSDLFLIRLVGGILTVFTLGIYMFWLTTNLVRFQTNNQVFREITPGA